jgi:hypothetical protein
MNDFSESYLKAKRLLEEYYKHMISKNNFNAAIAANELVEAALKLEDIAHELDAK